MSVESKQDDPGSALVFGGVKAMARELAYGIKGHIAIRKEFDENGWYDEDRADTFDQVAYVLEIHLTKLLAASALGRVVELTRAAHRYCQRTAIGGSVTHCGHCIDCSIISALAELKGKA